MTTEKLTYGRMDDQVLTDIISTISDIERTEDAVTTTGATTEREIRDNIIREATGVDPMDLGNALGAAFDALDATSGEDGYARLAAVATAVERYRKAATLVNPTIAYVHPRDGYVSIDWYSEQVVEGGVRIEVSSSTSVGQAISDEGELNLAIGDDLFLSLTDVRLLAAALERAELVMEHVGADRG